MRALLSRAPGGPETLVLAEVATPAVGAGEVLIDVRACGVNFPDSLMIEDRYQIRPPRPFAPGAEIAGIVSAVGEGVDRFSVGERVFGFPGFGGMAEQVAVKATRCSPIPDGMDFETAAAFMMTYGTSHHALKDRAALKPGETLLVLGAAGGVGLAAVELGRAAGARVIAAVSSAEKATLAEAHGAERSVVYPTGPFDGDGRRALSKLFKDAVGDGGADVVYDPVGGDYTEAALRAIAWEGRLLVVGFPAGIPKLPLNLTLLKSCQVVGVFWGAFVAREPARDKVNASELLTLYAEGKLRPVVSKTYKLAEGGAAITALAQRSAAGKLVVVMK